jgi:uncharacterized protein (TIGR03086 family)
MKLPRHGSAVVTLPSDTEILITRRFDASAASVFHAWTTPDLVCRWWGSDEAPLVVCEIDLRVGGDWRYVSRHRDHGELGWHGTYEDIVLDAALVSSEVFEGVPDAESRNALTLSEHDGVTTLTVLVTHTTRENRDGHINSGMEAGMQQTLDRLGELISPTEPSHPKGNVTMSDTSDHTSSDATPSATPARWRHIAGAFTARVEGVPIAAWSNPSPCEGWVARDIVKHLVEWVPPFLNTGAGLVLTTGPDIATDPSGAWRHLNDQIIAVLDSPGVDQQIFDHPQAGQHPLDQAIDRFILGDVLIHTWDLARATGQDEHLDADMVNDMLGGMEAIADLLVQSGHYGPRTPTSATADNQTKLLALTGRNP